MTTRYSRTAIVPMAAAAAAAVTAAAALLYANKCRQRRQPMLASRKSCRTAYIHIPTSHLHQSADFFRAFGMLDLTSEDTLNTEHDTKDSSSYIILACPNSNSKSHQPYILLEQMQVDDSNSNSKACASDAGCIGRLCLGVKDVYQTVQRLQDDLQMKPIALPVCDRPGMAGPDNKEPNVVIVAYRDAASGAMLELVSLDMTSILTKIAVTVATTVVPSLQFPLFVHANVNASDYARSLAAYQALGYSKISKEYGKIQNNLYKALEIPDPGIATYVTLLQTPEEDLFCLDLIEWEETKQAATANANKGNDNSKNNQPTMMRFAMTVNDLPNDLDRILLTSDDSHNKLWTLVNPPKLCDHPAPLGKTLVATLQDPDGLKVDVVEYPNPIILQELQQLNDSITTNNSKVVLITGCDSGFGRTLACRMALLGFQVVAACYSQDGANYLRHVATDTVVADLGTPKGVQAVVKQTRAVLDSNNRYQLWAIVNNAAVCDPGNVEWQTPAKYHHAMQVNFMAPVTIVHELINDLKACRDSRVLNVSSVCGMLSQPTNSAYCATKHALEAFSDSLRCELRPYGIHVCIVQPATMKTPLGMSYWDSWYESYQAAPKDRQSSFQAAKMDQFLKASKEVLHGAAEDPSITTTAMVKALVESNPPTRLRTGAAANVFFRPVSYLPDKTRDGLLWKIFGFDSVHTPVEH